MEVLIFQSLFSFIYKRSLFGTFLYLLLPHIINAFVGVRSVLTQKAGSLVKGCPRIE